MRHALRALAVVVTIVPCVLAAAGCGSSDDSGEAATPAASALSAGYPVSIQDCGRTLTFDKAPSRVVAGYEPVLEVLVGLGLTDKVVGQMKYDEGAPMTAEQDAAHKRIPVVSNDISLPPREKLLSLRPDLVVPDLVTQPPAGVVEPRIRFGDVSFRYGADLPDALHEVSFEIAPGETVALVGHSGAGKSTAAHLLLRFWDVTGGAISVGGHDLRELPQHTLRELVTFVPQDTYLFHASVAQNIRLGRPDATDDQVRRAARQALADEFITALPEGYDTIVGERGAKLSGGQRQRIALARAVLKDSPILVMDEPVSNLDAESELELTAAMTEARRGRTVLVIAHRLSTIKTADRLVVLDRGRVAEVGRHDELLAAGATYARLIAGQHVAGHPG